jgi:hypothetical protein
MLNNFLGKFIYFYITEKKFIESLWVQNLKLLVEIYLFIVIETYLLFPCEYILPLLNFVINNLEHFQINSGIHCANKKQAKSA